jgi:hypothetical protein
MLRVVATWWGFAEADRGILGLVVAVLAVLALVYVLMRANQTRSRRAAAVKHARR